MAQHEPLPRLPDEIVDAAIMWSIRLGRTVDADRVAPTVLRAFERWRQGDPRHAQAWNRVASLQTAFSDIPPQLALNVLQSAPANRAAPAAGRARRGALKLLSLSAVALFAGISAYDHAPWQRLLADASNTSDKPQTMHLDDGSAIVLNLDSAISIDMRGAQRRIVLRRGEIMISTGADAQSAARRTFWVDTPFGTMQALGTRFVVRLERERARIAVQEGAVELHPADGSAAAVVAAGDSRWLSDSGTLAAPAQGLDSTAFADGVIAGKNMRLGDLIAELARYRSGRLSCDEAVADLRLSGIFHINNTEQALQFLAQTQPVSIRYRTRFWVAVGAPAHG